MAASTTFDLPNFVGELFMLTRNQNPFMSMIGGITGGGAPVDNGSTEFTWQDTTGTTAEQPAILEGADPVDVIQTRDDNVNVVQIFQRSVSLSYTKLAAINKIGTPSDPASAAIGGLNNPVRNELDWQVQQTIARVARDMNFTFHNGTYQNPSNNSSARKTRGMDAAITTHRVDAAGASFTAELLDELIVAMDGTNDTDGAPFQQPVLFTRMAQRVKISGEYGYAPESRTVGGVAIQTILTEIGELGIVTDKHVTPDDIRLYDLSVLRPRALAIPGKGFFFLEPKETTGATVRTMLYGEWGLESGPEQWHGLIHGLSTTL